MRIKYMRAYKGCKSCNGYRLVSPLMFSGYLQGPCVYAQSVTGGRVCFCLCARAFACVCALERVCLCACVRACVLSCVHIVMRVRAGTA